MARPTRRHAPGNRSILFRVAAGPRMGTGHLMRARRIARLVGLPAVISVRGPHAGQLRFPVAGIRELADTGTADVTLRAARPRVLVVDDPSETAGAPWIAAARRLGCLTMSIVDYGIGTRSADLVVDGAVPAPVRRLDALRTICSPRMAVVDPLVARALRRARRRIGPGGIRVLMALGGGPRARYADRLAEAVCAVVPQAVMTVAAGFGGHSRPGQPERIRWVGPQPSLVPCLADTDIAIVAGGLTLYEACALGIPTVAIPVVGRQWPSVSAMARKGAVMGLRARPTSIPPPPAVVGRLVSELIRSASRRRSVARRARALVDGGGAARVAGLVRGLAEGTPVPELLAASRRPRARME